MNIYGIEVSVVINIFVIITFLILGFTRKWYANKSKGIFQIVMLAYLICVISVTFDKIPLETFDIKNLFNFSLDKFHRSPYKSMINLRIFDGPFRRDQLLNIIMAIPFGMLIPFIKKRSILKNMILCLCFGLAIETGQLMVNIIGNGFFRTIDIDDVICNFAGGAIGLVIFYITASIMRLFEHKMYKKKFWWYVSKIT